MPYTLLLADDSATIQRVIELTFADEDVTVVAVGDGDQAIAQLETAAPDIVLADIGMPGKNGYDVAQYIRQSPALSHIPVVLLSGAFEPVDQTRADDAHCDGVLAKPFEPQQVIGRVKELLARPRRGPEDAAATTEVAVGAAPEIEPPEQGPVSPSLLPAVIDRSHYFDQLDAAFATLTSNKPSRTEPPVTATADPVSPAQVDIDSFNRTAADASAVEPWDDMSAAANNERADADLPLSYQTTQAESSVEAPDPVAPPVPSQLEQPVAAEPIAAPDDRLAPIEESQPIEPEVVAPTPTMLEPLEPPAPETREETPAAEPSAPEPPAPNPVALPALADAFAALLAAEQHQPVSARLGIWPSTAAPSAEVREELVEEVVRRVLDRLSGTVRDAVADLASQVAERLIREEIERIKASIK